MTNPIRKIIGLQTRHAGGFARVEEDTKTGVLYVTCSGCNTERAYGHSLPAAAAELLRLHPGPVIAG